MFLTNTSRCEMASERHVYCLQVNFWERLRLTIPYTAMEVNAQRERYRILRVNVQTVVRMYNKVTA